MIGLISRLSAKVSDLSLLVRCAWLNGCLLVVLAAALAIASVQEGVGNTQAVLVAFAICTVAANAALILSLSLKAPGGLGVLGGSLVGMALPLAAGMIFQQRGGELAQAGVFGWIVVFYLAALVVKTLLVAPTGSTGASTSTGSKSETPNRVDPTCQAGA